VTTCPLCGAKGGACAPAGAHPPERVTDMARQTDPGPVSSERLYLKDGEITTEKGGRLVAAEGAPIAPEFHDQVKQYLAGKEAESGAGDERKPAASREAAPRATAEAEGREVKADEPKAAASGAVTTSLRTAAEIKKAGGK
jgi:hypothetical protein